MVKQNPFCKQNVVENNMCPFIWSLFPTQGFQREKMRIRKEPIYCKAVAGYDINNQNETKRLP